MIVIPRISFNAPQLQSQTILLPLLIRTHIVILNWARLTTKPPRHLFNVNRCYKDSKTMNEVRKLSAPKPDTKTPKNYQVEEYRGRCVPDQDSGVTLWVLRYPSGCSQIKFLIGTKDSDPVSCPFTLLLSRFLLRFKHFSFCLNHQ